MHLVDYYSFILKTQASSLIVKKNYLRQIFFIAFYSLIQR